MDAIARALAGSTVMFAGVMFTLFGAERDFDGLGFFVGMLGLALAALALFILLRVAGLLPAGVREARGFEVAPPTTRPA